MAAVEQLSLFDRAEEARAYHDPARAGFFSILVNDQGEKKQSSHRLIEMPTVLELIDKTRDTWMTQAEFIRPNRRVVNLARIGLLFADLDTYREPWATGRTPEELAASVLYYCAQEGIPTPSMLIFSGRGIQAKWLLDGVIPRAALPRWNACQRYLVDRLLPLGADRQAKDASRVLRMVDTVNQKSGEICRVVHVENGADGHPVNHTRVRRIGLNSLSYCCVGTCVVHPLFSFWLLFLGSPVYSLAFVASLYPATPRALSRFHD